MTAWDAVSVVFEVPKVAHTGLDCSLSQGQIALVLYYN